MLYITEYGVYSILKRSKKPISHRIFIWFAKDLIPKLALEQYNIPFSKHEKYKERVKKGILKYYKELEFSRAFQRNR
jgi:prophage antirepressor-like protein